MDDSEEPNDSHSAAGTVTGGRQSNDIDTEPEPSNGSDNDSLICSHSTEMHKIEDAPEDNLGLYGDQYFYLRMTHYKNVIGRSWIPFPYLDYCPDACQEQSESEEQRETEPVSETSDNDNISQDAENDSDNTEIEHNTSPASDIDHTSSISHDDASTTVEGVPSKFDDPDHSQSESEEATVATSSLKKRRVLERLDRPHE